MKEMIEVKELYKSYDGRMALNGLNITVPTGSVYGLVGPNGAGKSTVIRHLAGILRQDAGEVLVDGAPVYENPEIKSRMAYIPDDIFYYTQASIRDMMQLFRDEYRSFSDKRFEELGELFKLDPKQSMRKLSKGMMKQAAFWLALSICPEYIILDEPVDGLDPVTRRLVWRLLLSDVAERGTTILVSSHNLRELEDVCDYVGIMNNGAMLLQRSLSELQDNIVKVQAALPEGKELPKELDVLHSTATGRLRQMIIRGNAEEVTNILATAEPLFMDVLPLSLEEIFIYEQGGDNSEVKNIIV